MWSVAVAFVILLIVRYSIRLYQQHQIIKEIQQLEEEQLRKAKAVAALTTEIGEDETEENDLAGIKDGTGNETNEPGMEENTSETEDYDEMSTGHNVTKRLTADNSRNFHLTSNQIQQGRDLNKELMERLTKRKMHSE